MMGRRTVWAACAALFLSGSVNATVLVQSSLGGLAATVADLDPDDGIAASVAFRPVDPAALPAWERGSVSAQYSGATVERQDAAALSDLSVQVTAPGNALATAALADRGDVTTQRLMLSASGDFAAPANPVYGRDAQANGASDFLWFVLAPHTSLTVTVSGFGSGRLDDGWRESFSNTTTLLVDLWPPGGGPWVDEDLDYHYVESPAGWAPGPYAHEEAFTLTVQVANLDDSAANGSLRFTGGADVYARVPPPVPEPATAGMLAAGLGLLGWRCRRRQARQSR